MEKRGRKPSERVVLIPIDQINRPEISVRRTIKEEYLKDLEESILRIGLIQPILVKKTIDQRYEVVVGERRYLAHLRLGRPTIKGIVTNANKSDCETMKMDENQAREEINIMDEAHYYRKLQKEHNYSQKEIASRIGKSEGYISQRLALIKAPAIIQEALEDGVLSFSVARELMKVDDPRELKRLVLTAIQNGITPAVARDWANQYTEFRKDNLNMDPLLDQGENVVDEYSMPTFKCDVCNIDNEIPKLNILRVCPLCNRDIKSAANEASKKEPGK